MEFDIKKKHSPHIHKYPAHEIDTARDFSKKAIKEFGGFIKSIVLFGSAARKTRTTPGDIDILVIVNDLTIIMTPEAVEAYRIIMEKIIGETNKKIHLTTLKFTHFWEYSRNGDPIAINLLRDGVPIIDSGVFEPMQALLYAGRIRPTSEAIWAYYNRAPRTLSNSKGYIMQAVIALYWAAVDSAHAALMKVGAIPPSPEHVGDMIKEKLVPKKLATKKDVETMKNIYTISKQILHQEIKEVKGEQYDKLLKSTEAFVDKMRKIIERKDLAKYL